MAHVTKHFHLEAIKLMHALVSQRQRAHLLLKPVDDTSAVVREVGSPRSVGEVLTPARREASEDGLERGQLNRLRDQAIKPQRDGAVAVTPQP
jgi:hypothetical protein